MTFQVFGICLASAATILQLFCVIKAREHTSQPLPPVPPSAQTTTPPPIPYNSSASAVSAIFLVVLVFTVCFIRSARPQLILPCINSTIVIVVTSSVAPTLLTLPAALTFAKQLLVINLTGLSLSVAVNMLVWPTTNRKAFKIDVGEWQSCIESCLVTRAAVMEDLLAVRDHQKQTRAITAGDVALSWPQQRGEKTAEATVVPAEGRVDTVAPMQELLAVVAKLESDLRYAQREISIGKLSASDFAELRLLLYEVLQPVIGLMSGAGHVHKLVSDVDFEANQRLLLAEHEKAKEANDALVGILRHAMRDLEVLPRILGPDAEIAQGTDSFRMLKERVELLRNMRHERIEAWQLEYSRRPSKVIGESEQSLLFVVLETQELLSAACTAALRLAEFANSKEAEGTMSSVRLQLPHVPPLRDLSINRISKARSFGTQSRGIRHPRYLQVDTMWERVGSILRRVSHVLESPHAGFGARIAFAVLCSQIPAFLRQTQLWYNAHRAVWASITIATVTTRTVGQSVFGVACQVAGTFCGCLCSLIAWYIVDRKVPGVIIFYLLLQTMVQYPARKHPSLTPFSTAIAITFTLFVGYELVSERLGKAVVTSTGQPYYPPYLLSWMALLAILAGVGIAAFWTLFPFPILESKLLSQKLADSINTLAELHLQTHLAVYDAIKKQETVRPDGKSEYLGRVSSIQLSFIASLSALRQLLANSRYQIHIGGQFPRHIYAALLNNIDSVFRSISMAFYASRTFSTLGAEAAGSAWMEELRRVASRNEDVELRALSVLSICADSISKRHPLPPFLDIPETSSLLIAVKTSPMDLLSAKHALEPGYAALAALQAATEIVTDEMRELVRMTGELVGYVEYLYPQAA